MVTDLAKNKTIKEAMDITRDDISKELDGLPPLKLHCSNLATDALRKALNEYLTKNKDKK